MSEYRTFNQRLNNTNVAGLGPYPYDKIRLDVEVRKENFGLIHALARKHDLTFWLQYGTLLGAIRSNSFIEHDQDTDFGVYVKDREVVFELFKSAIADGFNFFRSTATDSLVTLERKGESIDFYHFHKMRNGKWNCEDATVPGKYFDNLEAREFLGRDCLVPSFAEEYLSKLYGSGWRIPCKGVKGVSCVI